MGKVYVGDVGTEISLDCGTDISAATVMKIKVLKPDDSAVEWTASLDGTTSIKYVVDADDLDQAGTWKLQAYVEVSAWSGLGETAKLKVYEPYA